MKRKPQFLIDLVDTARVKPSLIDEALGAACPTITQWCESEGSGLTRKQLREQVIQHLPPAFRIGIAELARGNTGRFGWHSPPPRLTFAWAAYLDVFSDGQRVHTVTIECVARMFRNSGEIAFDSQSNRLQLEPDVSWLCMTDLTLRESESIEPATFYAAQGEVTFASRLL